MKIIRIYTGNVLFARAIRNSCGEFCGQCAECILQKLQDAGNKQEISVQRW